MYYVPSICDMCAINIYIYIYIYNIIIINKINNKIYFIYLKIGITKWTY